MTADSLLSRFRQDLYEEDWWLQALLARDPFHAIWHRQFFSHNYEITAYEVRDRRVWRCIVTPLPTCTSLACRRISIVRGGCYVWWCTTTPEHPHAPPPSRAVYVLTGNATYLTAMLNAWSLLREWWIMPGGSITLNEVRG